MTSGWVVLYEGFSQEEPQQDSEHLTVYNTHTGQRFRIAISPETPTPVDIIFFAEGDIVLGDNKRGFYDPHVNGDKITWHQWLSVFDETERAELFVFIEDHFVRYKAVLDLDVYNTLRKETLGKEPMSADEHTTRLAEIEQYRLIERPILQGQA